jgi:anthraniloyl-CoA monooxygenase
MNIVCIGGGPAGLYRPADEEAGPAHTVTVIERNRPEDTFGWGVVFSDQTLSNLVQTDEQAARRILQSFNHWDDIDVHIKGRTITSGGHGFCGIGRHRLLKILQERSRELGVRLMFQTDATEDRAVAAEYEADLVIASDGINSRIRTAYADSFQPDLDMRRCRFVWLGTKKLFKRSPSPSSRPSTVGSRPTPTSTTGTLPPLSSRFPRKSGSRPDWTR